MQDINCPLHPWSGSGSITLAQFPKEKLIFRSISPGESHTLSAGGQFVSELMGQKKKNSNSVKDLFPIFARRY